MNAKMPALKACFEAAGFSDVRTLLSSGNVVFNARASSLITLGRRAEATMQSELGHCFNTIVRSTAFLQALVEADPFATFTLSPEAKRVIAFLRSPAESDLDLPLYRGDASILRFTGAEAFCGYVPNKNGSALMDLLERNFGKDITTRTLDTVRKCAWA